MRCRFGLEHYQATRRAFHEKIGRERGFERYPGTFEEYNTKVIQFGYVAMFSAAFPLAAICSAVANFNEIRLDAIKTLSSRRPRYQGAEDIGSWQAVLGLISWVALPMNVAILVGACATLSDPVGPACGTRSGGDSPRRRSPST